MPEGTSATHPGMAPTPGASDDISTLSGLTQISKILAEL